MIVPKENNLPKAYNKLLSKITSFSSSIFKTRYSDSFLVFSWVVYQYSTVF